MQRRHGAVLAVLLPLFLLITQLARAEDITRDGNWWLQLDEQMRVVYLMGTSDGLQLGNEAVSRMYTDLEDAKADSGLSPEEVAEALGVWGRHRSFLARHFAQPVVGQVADGLNEFYGDYKNRNILVTNGIWYVAKAIAGASPAELDSLAVQYRKAASRE